MSVRASEINRSVDVVGKYLRARDAVDRAKSLADERKKRLDDAEAAVLQLYEQEGISGVKVDGRNVVLTRTLRASPRAGMRPALCVAMHEHGLDDIVHEDINTQTLASWVRECDRDGVEIPDDIAQLLNVAEMFGLSVRKG